VNVDPVPIALKLWQHTRLNGGLAAPSGGTEFKSAETPDLSDQHPGPTSIDPSSARMFAENRHSARSPTERRFYAII
jgi:hypothetical protein